MLPALIEGYIALRQAMGFKFFTTAGILRDYGTFAHARNDVHVRWRTAVAWAQRAPTHGGSVRRLACINQLSIFLRAEDTGHELIPKHLRRPRSRSRLMPHIFSPVEIATILASAAEIGVAGAFRSHTLVTLYGLLAATGLRVAEALRLRLRDFRDDTLIIRETKFQKTRQIPLHSTTVSVLKRYIARRRKVVAHTDHIFVSAVSGRVVKYWTAWKTFRGICLRAGIGLRSPSGRMPRIHDLRHTFAVRALERCPAGRNAVERHMAALSAYLGHSDPRHTFWYLHRTPQLLRDVARACERVGKGSAS
jgi:integrase